MLEVDRLDASYGRVRALRGVSLRVETGEIVTLLGSNGAGKTTLLRAISGLLRAGGGAVRFNGQRISGKAPDEIVRLGIGHAPEGRRVFARMTVRENLELGAYTRRSRSDVSAGFARVFAAFPQLRERIAQKAGTLSGGEQQMLAIGRALMSRPHLLMLDEPSLGLSPLLVKRIFGVIAELNSAGTAVLLVEQNATQALEVASRGYVLELGRIALSDTAENLLGNDAVRESYLGGG
ncbi:MAG: ABC transporter ATP-binding protein [Candidatus Eremiobacteraeota bacterium]|nr:ABC transporter ATP-binding protein [Candidatus Eremiobacteraeota bacterium]